MKIEAIDLSAQTQKEASIELGLGHIEMSRLSKHVVLAGANGAGKSRILRLIEQYSDVIKQGSSGGRRDYGRLSSLTNEGRKRLEFLRNGVKAAELEFERVKIEQTPKILLIQSGFPAPHTAPGMQIQLAEEQLKDANQAVEGAEQQLKGFERNLAKFHFVKSASNSDIQIVSYRIKTPALTSAEEMSPNAVRSNYSRLRQETGAGIANECSSAYAKHVIRTAEIASHPNRPRSDDFQHSEEAWKTFVSLLTKMLGADCSPYWNNDDSISLFGRQDYEISMSDGQKVLFQLACCLHAQGTKLEDAIIFLDEPENHLHPAALVEVISRLDLLTSNGQLWIATHSVPLIAHLAAKDPACLWYVENGTVKHAGRKPEKVLEGLMGGTAGAQALQDFTLLPGQIAINRFLAECLEPPAVVGPSVNDPQLLQISSLIHATRLAESNGARLRVLDYGAGKARLLEHLAAFGRDKDAADQPSRVCEWLDYVAFDMSDEHASACKAEITSTYGVEETQSRYFNDFSQISSNHDASSFDLIVMSNVLHEIEPETWLELFGKEGELTKLLKPDGGLLIVEDYKISSGELAHRDGFLLLDEAELKKLFAWKEVDRGDQDNKPSFLREISVEPFGKRLAMHWIGRPMVERVTSDTRKESIETLKKSSSDLIRQFQRTRNATYKHGHAYALAAQLYANAALWLEAHGT